MIDGLSCGDIEPTEPFAPAAVTGTFRCSDDSEFLSGGIADIDSIASSHPDIPGLVRLQTIHAQIRVIASGAKAAIARNVMDLDDTGLDVGYVELLLIRGESDAVRRRGFGDDTNFTLGWRAADTAALAGDLIDARLRKVSEIDAAVDRIDKVVWALQAVFGEHGDRAVLLCSRHATAALGNQETPLMIEREAIRLVAVFAQRSKLTALPFQYLVVGNIAEQQKSTAAKDRPFCEREAGIHLLNVASFSISFQKFSDLASRLIKTPLRAHTNFSKEPYMKF